MPRLKKAKPKGCPHCGWETSRWLYHVPEDLAELSKVLHVPVETVLARLISGKLLVREINLPPLKGEYVYIKDALKGLRDRIPFMKHEKTACSGRTRVS